MTPPSTPFVTAQMVRPAGLFEDKEGASSDQADDEDEDWKVQPKFCQFQQEPQRTGYKEKRHSTTSLENKIKISYKEENTERIETESMVQFEARMKKNDKKSSTHNDQGGRVSSTCSSIISISY